MLAQMWWQLACPQLAVGSGCQDRATSKKPEPTLQSRSSRQRCQPQPRAQLCWERAGGGTRRASLMRGGGSLCPLHWGPCAHSIPVDAHGERLSLVGLGGPTVSGWLRAEVPRFGCLPGCPFINGTGHSTGGSVAWRLLPVKKWEVQRAVK